MSVLIPLKAGRTPTEIVLQTIWRGGVPDFVAQERDEAARREAEKERKRLEQAARREASNRLSAAAAGTMEDVKRKTCWNGMF